MSQNPSMSSSSEIDRRLSRLERENRRLKISAALTSVLLIVSFMFLLYGPPFTRNFDRIYRGSMFILTNEDEGNSGGMYVAEDIGPSFALYDRNKKTRIHLIMDHSGDPEIRLNDKDGKNRVRLFLAEDGSPVMTFLDGLGQVIWSAP